jgi:hypothetical protein
MDRSLPPQAGISAVVRLAESLLAEAEACPALIMRSAPVGVGVETQAERLPTLALLSEPALDVRPYLEHLVSLAAASARRSELLAEQARRLSRNARRQMLAACCMSLLAVLFGVVGFFDGRNQNTGRAQLRSQTNVLAAQQQHAPNEIAASAAQPSDTRATETNSQRVVAPAAPRSVAPQLQAPSIRYFAQPWPDSQRNAIMSNSWVSNHFLAGFEGSLQAALR